MHEALLDPGGTIPTNRKQADNLIKHYAFIGHKPTISSNRKIEKDENSNPNSNSIHNTTGPSNYQKCRKLQNIRSR